MILQESPTPPVEYRTTIIEKVIEVEGYRCQDDIDCLVLAEAIYYEGRGESIEGQIAIGFVIMNRADSPYFPDSVVEVVRTTCQFSYRCDGSMKRGFQDIESYQVAMLVAENIMKGEFDDPTNGSNHYLNPKKVKRTPKWAKEYPQVVVIGNHSFHKRM